MQGEDSGGNILYYKDEREEAVLAKQIKNISKYINFIALRENNFNLLKYGYDADFEWVFDDNKTNVIKGRKMNDLAQIWQDIVNYCQSLFEKSQPITEVSKKSNKLCKKKKKTPKKAN